MMKLSKECVKLVFIVCFLIGGAFAEDKWVWSGDRRSNDRQDRKYSSNGGNNQNSRFDGIQERYDVTESTSKRTHQADEFPDDFGGSESGRFNFNIFGRPGQPPSGPFGPVPPQNNIYPNPQNGILVGPGGPTGIIGRPPPGSGPIRPPINRPNGNPANGILVGPGGPTGIIGRPPLNYPGGPGINNNVGPQVFPTVSGIQGNPSLYPRPVPGPISGPGAYPSGIFPGGGIPPSPGAYPGGYPGEYPGGQGLFPVRGYEQNYYLHNSSPFRSRSNVQAFDESEGRSVGGRNSKDSERALNRNILKKSVS